MNRKNGQINRTSRTPSVRSVSFLAELDIDRHELICPLGVDWPRPMAVFLEVRANNEAIAEWEKLFQIFHC